MADDTLQKLAGAVTTPIAQLSSELPDSSSRAVRGVVTIVWPYSAVKKSFAFILAEREFRLRPAKGQIRLNFTGASAKAISECGLRSSDEVLLSLDGAQWEDDGSRMSGHDWQLNFSDTLSLQVKLSETGEKRSIKVNHPLQPEPEETTGRGPEPEDEGTALDPIDLPPTTISAGSTPAKPNAALARKLHDGEFESPAFIKRARISYGALFEDGFDIFEDDGGVKGRGRKRTRFGRESGAWRYSSQSRSPEPVASQRDDLVSNEDDRSHSASPRPGMTDEGCQTMELDFPGTQPLSPKQPHQTVQSAPEINPFISNGSFMDQGHQTFPLNGWTSTTSASQPPFADSGIFEGGQEQAGALILGQEHRIPKYDTLDPWNSQPVEDHSITYPELPTDPQHNLLVPPVPYRTDVLPGIPSAAEVGDLGLGEQHHSRAVPDNLKSSNVGNVVEDGHSDLEQTTSNYPPLNTIEAEPRLSPYPASHNMLEPVAKQTSSFAQEVDTVSANPFARGISTSLDRAAGNIGTSAWAPINSTALRATSTPLTGQLDSNDGQTSESALVIDESDSEGEDNQLEEEYADGHNTPSLNRNSLPGDPGRGVGRFNISEAEFEREASYYQNLEEADDENEEDEDEDEDQDEEGGDYDTRNYLAPEDDQDDSHDEDLRPHRLEPEFDDGEGESWDEDEGEEYESDYETDDEVARSQVQPRLPPRIQQTPASASGPVVIDLLSSSEDDEVNDQSPPRRFVAGNISDSRPHPSSVPLTVGPTDVGFESQEEAEIEDEDGNDSEEQLEHEFEQGQNQSELEEEDERHSESDDLDSEDGALSDNEDAEEVTERGALEDNVDAEGDEKPEADDPREDSPILEQVDMQSVTSQQVTSPVSKSETAGSIRGDNDVVMRDAGAEESDREPQQGNESTLRESELSLQGDEPILQENEPTRQANDPTPEEKNESNPQEENLIPPQKEKDPTDVELEEEELSEVDVVETRGLGQESSQPVLNEAGAEEEQNAGKKDDTPPQVEQPVHSSLDADALSPTADTQGQVEQQAMEIEVVAPSSPPLTQPFQPRIHEGKSEVEMQESSILVESQNAATQLPTPLDTQTLETTLLQETSVISAMEVEEVEEIKETELAEEQHLSSISPPMEQTVVQEGAANISQGQDMPVQLPPTMSDARGASIESNPISLNTSGDALADDTGTIVTTNAVSPVLSHMSGDEALQAALREEDSRFVSQPSSPVLGSTVLKSPAEVEAEINVAVPELPGPLEEEPLVVKETGDESPTLDPSVRLARASIASRKASRRREATPEITRPHTRSKNSQKSPTPEIGDDSIQLAKSSLHTPSKTPRVDSKADAKAALSSPASSKIEEEAGSLTASKLKLVRHLRDVLPELTNLKVIRQHTGKSLDVMAVAMMSPADPQRAKGGPREYMMSFTITDHSIGPNSVVEVQLYRQYKDKLPKVKAGDVVLLRNFSVISLKGKGFGLRTNDGSSWAVFDREDEPAQVNGPPVEYGEDQAQFAAYLRDWFSLLDEKAKQKLEAANQKIIEAGRSK